jgi:hypothetical protein
MQLSIDTLDFLALPQILNTSCDAIQLTCRIICTRLPIT